MEQDLKAARNLQSVLLLREAPPIKGLEIAIRSRPAREITGDVYDIFEHGTDYAVFAFGDVSGKGAAAALYGAMVSGLLRTLAPAAARSRRTAASCSTTCLRERKVDAQYVTLLVLVWERAASPLRHGQRGRASRPWFAAQGEIIKPRVEGVPGRDCWTIASTKRVIFEAQPGDVIAALFRRHHRPAEPRERGVSAAATWRVLLTPLVRSEPRRLSRIRF